MPLSPGLLRPRSPFNPRTLPGLALWLDAADSSTVFQSDTAAAASVSAPTDIPGCIGWWDASDAMTITADPVTQKVSQWAGKVGGRHFTQSNTANQPVLEAATLNGRNVIRLSSATQMTVANDKTTWNPLHQAGATGGWVFAVFQPFNTSSTEQWGRFLGTDNFTSANAGWNVFLDDRATLGLNGSLRFGISRGVAGTATADSIVNAALSTDTAAYVASLRFDPNNAAAQERLRLFTNGVGGNDIVSNTGAASAANASADLTLGIAGMSTTGFIAELIIYGALLSYADRARIERYLASKWGVSDVFASASATNNPVGAWLDKSGLGRHATQTTAGSRPMLGSLGSRSALAFSGANSLTTPPYTARATSTYIYVSRHDDTAETLFQTGPVNGFHSHLVEGTSKFRRIEAASSGVVLGSNIGVGSSALWCVDYSNDAVTVRHNGAQIGSTSLPSAGAVVDSTRTTTIGRLGPGEPYAPLNGRVAEFLVFAGRHLSGVEKARLERYLANKWGIILAPQVSNADAQDWINRVYANGGTVSASTASVVNTFCNDIDAAGIRDRFYRLNLFCGNSDASLNAVRTPLYRGPSLGGAIFGNTIDTNINFVAGDYVETGVGGGLKGNGSSKYLNTGFAQNILLAGDRHLSVYEIARDPNAYRVSIGSRTGASAASNTFYLTSTGVASQFAYVSQADAGYFPCTYNAYTNPNTHFIGTQSPATAVALYVNGAVVASASVPAPTPSGLTQYVFALNDSGAVGDVSAARLGGYSIGLSMSAAQALAYSSAMQAFQASLSRSV